MDKDDAPELGDEFFERAAVMEGETVIREARGTLTSTETPTRRLNRLCREIHGDNVAAGWWSDLATGESILASRNRGELMMLQVSELSEASHGHVGDLRDDKLPHRKMFDVELVDTAIRLFDSIGAEGAEIPDILALTARFRSAMHSETRNGALMLIVNEISGAMEHHRKGRTAGYCDGLIAALAGVIALAHRCGTPLFDIIEEKRAFNRNRADHKIENRRQDDGKKY